MQIAPFHLERWQSVWENQVELNISESGVMPMTVNELVQDPEELHRILNVPLGYPQTNGSEELRAKIASLYPGASAANVLVTCGCSEANYLAAWSVLEPGDEVVFMLPNYMQVRGLAQAFGATVKKFWLREELEWMPELSDLKRLITPKTRLIAICNPNNPTGSVLSEDLMEGICAAAEKVGAYVLADEVYRGAEFAGTLSPTFWGRYERVLCTGGLSKAYGLPGLRTGWVIATPKMAEKLWGYHDYTSIGPVMLTDRLAAYALGTARRAQILERTRQILKGNYPVLREWLKGHEGVFTHLPPAAGAIAWIGYQGDRKSTEFADELRTRKGVLLVPGEHMGMDSYFRIGFGGESGHLQRALSRVSELMAMSAGA